jgi:hypothetical protein
MYVCVSALYKSPGEYYCCVGKQVCCVPALLITSFHIIKAGESQQYLTQFFFITVLSDIVFHIYTVAFFIFSSLKPEYRNA